MGKLIQISIYSVLLILVFLFFGSMLKSCGNSAVDTLADTTQKVADNIENAGGEIVAKAESAMEDVGEEFEGGTIDFSESEDESKSYSTKDRPAASTKATTSNTTSTTTSSSNTADEEEDYEPSYVVEDTTAPTKIAPVKKETPKKSNSNYGGSSGRYLLITGNYSQEGNAEEMVKKLKNKGFSNAEHVIFEGSRYYTVLAGKYPSMSEANSAKSKLGNIDSYVQKRRN